MLNQGWHALALWTDRPAHWLGRCNVTVVFTCVCLFSVFPTVYSSIRTRLSGAFCSPTPPGEQETLHVMCCYCILVWCTVTYATVKGKTNSWILIGREMSEVTHCLCQVLNVMLTQLLMPCTCSFRLCCTLHVCVVLSLSCKRTLPYVEFSAESHTLACLYANGHCSF